MYQAGETVHHSHHHYHQHRYQHPYTPTITTKHHNNNNNNNPPFPIGIMRSEKTIDRTRRSKRYDDHDIPIPTLHFIHGRGEPDWGARMSTLSLVWSSFLLAFCVFCLLRVRVRVRECVCMGKLLFYQREGGQGETASSFPFLPLYFPPFPLSVFRFPTHLPPGKPTLLGFLSSDAGEVKGGFFTPTSAK